MDVRSALAGLKADLYSFREETENLIQSLEDLSARLNRQPEKINSKRRRSWTIVAIGGGIVCAAGIGLSFVTLGGSIGLILAGGILCGVGGTTSSFRQRSTKFVTSQTQPPHLVERVENYNSRLIKIKEKALQIGRELQEYGNINHVFTRWCQFWSHLLLPGQYYAGDTEPEAKYRSKTNDVDWLLITEAIRNGQNVTTTKKSGRKFSKLKNGESNFLVNGNGLDIDTLLQNAEDAQKTKQHKISKSINDLIKQLEESSPSIKDIDSMILETMAEL